VLDGLMRKAGLDKAKSVPWSSGVRLANIAGPGLSCTRGVPLAGRPDYTMHPAARWTD
jgi:hypothetical protein